MKNQTSEPNNIRHKSLTVIGVIMCVVLIPILIINCTLLIKGYTNENKVPTVGGFAPMIVLTQSMQPEFDGGDLIFIRTLEPEEVQVGDIIAFFDPRGTGMSVVSHRVQEVLNENGVISYITKGDNNQSADPDPIPSENLVGRYTGFSIAGAGSVAMFMQTTMGLIVCVALPVTLLVGYDIIRRMLYEKRTAGEKEELMAELEELRKLKEQQSKGE